MATTPCYFPASITLPSRNLSLTHHRQLLQPPPLTNFHLRASATNSTRTRRSRRLKSDAEICNDIRQFLAAVGLPEDYIPSTKELLLHGRNELANIVRRRGHKQIQELLTNSLNAGDNGKSADDDCGDLLTGQNVKVDSLVGGVTDTDSALNFDEFTSIPVESSANSSMEDGLGEFKDHAKADNDVATGNFYPIEVTIVGNDCSSSREGFYPNFDNQSSAPAEISGESSFEIKSSGNLECEDNLVGKLVGEITLPSAVPSMENHSNTSFSDSDLDTKDKEFSPLESSIDLSLEQKDWHTLGLNASNNNISQDIHSTSEVSIIENSSDENKIDSIAHSADSGYINQDPSANLSLEEKVTNFIQSGDLGPVEDHVSAISNGDHYGESKTYIESKPVVDMPLSGHPPKDNNVMALNGSSSTSKQFVPSGMLDQLLQDDHMPHQDLTHFNKDFDAEAPKAQNQREINHLKFMLHQKELELSRLKEQIEKEKLALSVLQTKAEAEISKARKLISEKDAELHVAEESLSGLKEVQIEFCGDGDVVEVAGSFNGWHHRIKMDPQPSSSVINLGGSRRSRSWSTMLWLYPGIYEIKLVVDGHWRIDPQRESVTRGHICNNILRVDR